MKMTERIYLIGMMGCGKSYWGKRLAALSGRSFFDLDQIIVSSAKKSIESIFETHGEGYFRELESIALRNTKQYDQAIIATGGGTPCFYNGMAWMKEHGTVVYLRTPVGLLVQRVKNELHLRPLLSGLTIHNLEAHLENLLKKREEFYAQADVIIEQPWPEQPEEVERQLLGLLQQEG